MTWKRAATVTLWVVLAIAPGGLWAIAAWASYRATRARLPQTASTPAQPSAQLG
jgi:hypothetical protein